MARLIVGAAKNQHMSLITATTLVMLTFKALNNQAPDYISELCLSFVILTLSKLCHALRSSCQTLLAVPKTKMKLYGDSLFPASAPIDFGMQVTGGH